MSANLHDPGAVVGGTCSSHATDLSLWQIRAFLVVSEYLSFTEAARRLNLTQPGLSRVVRELESALGVRLFERRADGVRLTQAGSAFLPHARKMVDCYAAVFAGIGNPAKASVTLAASNVVLSTVLPHLLESDIPKDSLACLTLVELASHEVVDRVATARADIGLCMRAKGACPPNINCQTLLTAPLGLLVGESVVLPNTIPDLAAIAHLPFVRLSDEMVLPQALREHGVVFDAYSGAAITSNSMPALYSAVAEGHMVTFVSAIAAAHAAPLRLRFVPLPHLLPSLDLCIVRLFESDQGESHLDIARALQECIVHNKWPNFNGNNIDLVCA